MNLKVHLAVSLVLAGALFPLYGYWSFFVFAFGFFIDIDHHLWYMFHTKNLSLKKSYQFHDGHAFDSLLDRLHIFHTVEVWILVLAFALVSTFGALLAIGLSVHLLLDFILMFREKSYAMRTSSLIGWVVRRV